MNWLIVLDRLGSHPKAQDILRAGMRNTQGLMFYHRVQLSDVKGVMSYLGQVACENPEGAQRVREELVKLQV